MSTAIVALTGHGARLGARILEWVESDTGSDLVKEGAQVYVPERFIQECPGAQPFEGPLSDLVAHLFANNRRLIMIMALGIVVRQLAPLVKDKRFDPAVVVLDEGGNYVISVLSGHLGGANDLARALAAGLGAVPVITTATDVHDLPAIDVLARDLNLVMEPFAAVRGVNSALVNGEPVTIYSEIALPVLTGKGVEVRRWSEFSPDGSFTGWLVLVTGRCFKVTYPRTLFLRPRNLVVGLGCRSGISREQVLDALDTAMELSGYSRHSVRTLATVDLRAGEPGLQEAAREWNVPLLSFTREQIHGVFEEMGDALNFSKFVHDKIGVGGVCEPVTLLAAPRARLVLPKTKLAGVTVAVAEEQSGL